LVDLAADDDVPRPEQPLAGRIRRGARRFGSCLAHASSLASVLVVHRPGRRPAGRTADFYTPARRPCHGAAAARTNRAASAGSSHASRWFVNAASSVTSRTSSSHGGGGG